MTRVNSQDTIQPGAPRLQWPCAHSGPLWRDDIQLSESMGCWIPWRSGNGLANLQQEMCHQFGNVFLHLGTHSFQSRCGKTSCFEGRRIAERAPGVSLLSTFAVDNQINFYVRLPRPGECIRLFGIQPINKWSTINAEVGQWLSWFLPSTRSQRWSLVFRAWWNKI